MKIGIVCYPTFGGSGVVATELGKADIVRREASLVSPMPERLVNILDRESILDLLALLESGPGEGEKK